MKQKKAKIAVGVGVLVGGIAVGYFPSSLFSPSSRSSLSSQTLSTTNFSRSSIASSRQTSLHSTLQPISLPIRSTKSNSFPASLPTSLPRTKEILASLEYNFPPASYSAKAFDFKLKWMSELPSCMGTLLPAKGQVYYEVVIEISEETLRESFIQLNIINSEINAEETAKFTQCLEYFFRDDNFNLIAVEYPEGGKMYSRGGIRFPIEDNFLYEFIRSNGEYSEGVPDVERDY